MTSTIKTSGLVLGIAFLSLFIKPSVVQAHQLEAEGNIGAILHIYPDDNLVSGREVEYLLSFQDVTKRFSLQKCDCYVTYKLGNEIVAKKPLGKESKLDSLNRFTFAEPGIYSMEITGQPADVADFQPFKLIFTKRVASSNIETQSFPVLLFTGIAGIVGLLVLAALATDPKVKKIGKSKN